VTAEAQKIATQKAAITCGGTKFFRITRFADPKCGRRVHTTFSPSNSTPSPAEGCA